MKLKIALTLFVLVLLLAPAPTHAQPTNPLVTGIVQTFPNGRTFTGALTTTSFSAVNGVLSAVGTISGTLTDATGRVLGSLTNAPITLPLTGVTGSCPILALHVGAIHLNVLGLQVDLNPIDLVITAQAAPGNLLGNLLCAVANLLNGGGPLGNLSLLLNQILAAL